MQLPSKKPNPLNYSIGTPHRQWEIHPTKDHSPQASCIY